MNLDHKHLIMTAFLNDPPRESTTVTNWLIELVDKIDMKILFGPYVTRCDTEGNEGVTGVVCIETSHCSIHIWDTLEAPFMKFDIYSCKEFSVDMVLNHIKQFSPKSCEYGLLDRNNKITIEEQHSIVF